MSSFTLALQGASLMPGSGVMNSPIDKVTSQGYDLQFGTNVLGTNRGPLSYGGITS